MSSARSSEERMAFLVLDFIMSVDSALLFVIHCSNEQILGKHPAEFKSMLQKPRFAGRVLALSTAAGTHLLVLKHIVQLQSELESGLHSKIVQDLTLLAIHNRIQSIRHLRLIDRIRTAFTNGDVEHIFVRGRNFAQRYYTDPAVRTSEDVDLIVFPHRVGDALDLLLSLGFRQTESIERRVARARWMSQMELRHGETDIVLDLNWGLCGNGGIGQMGARSIDVFARVRPIEGKEYRLAPEDELLDLFRHVGHGHDFASRVLKTCVDVAAFLRVEKSIDYDLLLSLAREGECVQSVKFLGWYYSNVYSNGEFDIPTFAGNLGRPIGWLSNIEAALFARFIITPLMSLVNRDESIRRAMAASFLAVVAKFWATDKFRRVFYLVGVYAFPPRSVLRLQTRGCNSESLGRIRARYYAGLIQVLPAILVGIIMRTFAIPMRDRV